MVDRLLGVEAPGQTHATHPLGGNNSAELRELLAGAFSINGDPLSGVTESKAMSIPAFSRGIELIAGTIAGLPLKTYRGDGSRRVQVASIFDRPQGDFAISAHDWVSLVVFHLVGYREAYLEHVRNVGGGLFGYWPVHPAAVQKVEWAGTQKRYHVHTSSEVVVYGTPDDPVEGRALTQILGPGFSGLRGEPLWVTHRRLFQIALAAEEATARVFTGALIRGLVTTEQDEDVDEAEAALIVEQLNARIAGPENANQFRFVNRHLKMTPWEQTNADAQYMETRIYQGEEFARMLGLPPHLLAMVDKQTSWGTGVAEQNIGLSRYTLMDWTSRIEAALLPLNPPGEFQEFDYSGLLQGSPAQEIELLLAQVAGGMLTVNEARAVRNLPPIAVETPSAEGEDEDTAA
jgi:HK97 family phage portal protein